MNIPVVAVITVTVIFIIFRKWHQNRAIKKWIKVVKTMLNQKEPIPIEWFWPGTYCISRKYGENVVTLTFARKKKFSGRVRAFLPKYMYEKVAEKERYYICYEHEECKLTFETRSSCDFVMSKIDNDDVFEDLPMIRRALERVIR